MILEGMKTGNRWRSGRRLSLFVLSFFLLFTACQEEEVHLNVTPDQVVGCWVKNGTQEYWRYLEDGTGVTWDESENYTEEESNLRFLWSVSGDVLDHVASGEMGNQFVPKTYTIKGISPSAMSWMDDYGQAYTLIKVGR